MSNEILSELLQFIMECFMVEEDEIDLDSSLVDQGIIDSIGLIEITAYLENKYNLVIDETKLTRENFGSVNKIAAFVQKSI